MLERLLGIWWMRRQGAPTGFSLHLILSPTSLGTIFPSTFCYLSLFKLFRPTKLFDIYHTFECLIRPCEVLFEVMSLFLRLEFYDFLFIPRHCIRTHYGSLPCVAYMLAISEIFWWVQEIFIACMRCQWIRLFRLYPTVLVVGNVTIDCVMSTGRIAQCLDPRPGVVNYSQPRANFHQSEWSGSQKIIIIIINWPQLSPPKYCDTLITLRNDSMSLFLFAGIFGNRFSYILHIFSWNISFLTSIFWPKQNCHGTPAVDLYPRLLFQGRVQQDTAL